jgi:sporulation protein YlmC with PRC-barrel domain
MRPLSSFYGREVVTESGRSIGRCHDLRAELTSSSLKVTALVVGRLGLLEHLGIRRLRSSGRNVHPRDTVPWDAIVRFTHDRIVVRDGTEVE